MKASGAWLGLCVWALAGAFAAALTLDGWRARLEELVGGFGFAVLFLAANALVVAALKTKQGVRLSWTDLGLRRPALRDLAWGAAAAAASLAAQSAVSRVVRLRVSETKWSALAMTAASSKALALAFAGYLLYAAAEELVFRGLIFHHVRRRVGRWTAYAASTLAFSLLHLRLAGLPFWFASGMVYCGAVELSGGLWAAIIAHALHNWLRIFPAFH